MSTGIELRIEELEPDFDDSQLLSDTTDEALTELESLDVLDLADPFDEVPVVAADDEMRTIIAGIEARKKECRKNYAKLNSNKPDNYDQETARRQQEDEFFRKAKEY